MDARPEASTPSPCGGPIAGSIGDTLKGALKGTFTEREGILVFLLCSPYTATFLFTSREDAQPCPTSRSRSCPVVCEPCGRRERYDVQRLMCSTDGTRGSPICSLRSWGIAPEFTRGARPGLDRCKAGFDRPE
jgi:hypothetical protein